MTYEVEAIGVVESTRRDVRDDGWDAERACVVLGERFEPDALQGIESFSHVEVVYLFHRVDPAKIVAGARHPRNNPEWPAVGIFAQRGKNRPNRIGTTICRVLGREGRRLLIDRIDAVDGTPVLDIKPVMAEFLPEGEVRQPSWSRELMRNYWHEGD